MERVIGRFIPEGQEVERDWIAAIVTRLTIAARTWADNEDGREFPPLPEFANQFEEIKYWASDAGWRHMDILMCVEPELYAVDEDGTPHGPNRVH